MGTAKVTDGKEVMIRNMIDFFKRLGYVPPRRDYNQIPDRPYTSGKIENTMNWGDLKRMAEEEIAPLKPPVPVKTVLPKPLAEDDYDRLAIMAGLRGVGLPTPFRKILANLVMSTETALLKLPRYHFPDTPDSLETAVLLLSDLHSGRSLFDDQGRVIYNQDIMIARLELVKEYALSVIEGRCRLGKINEVYIALAGDIIDGSGIFPGQELTQDLTCYVPQLCLAVAGIWDIIREIRTRFNLVVRVKGVRGNHGRQYKFCVANNNFDNLVFHLLHMMAVTYDPHGVSVEYSAGPPYLNFAVKGINLHMRHEAPPQTETAAARAKFLGWKQIHDYLIMLFGHRHHPGGGTVLDADICMNGSLVSLDDLAESMGVCSRPSQKLIGIKPGVGLTYQYNLYADRFATGGEADQLLKKYPLLQTPSYRAG